MQRDKGKRGERELAALWTEMGLPCRRGQQYSGVEGQDVVFDLTGIHCEVKRTEAFRMREAVSQAVRDAKGGEVPIVCTRSNRQPWVVVIRLEDVARFAELIYLGLASEGVDEDEIS